MKSAKERYYNADLAAKDADYYKVKLANDNFDYNVNRYKKDWDYLMAQIDEAVKAGYHMTEIPSISDREAQSYLNDNRLIPSEKLKQPNDRKAAAHLLQQLGYSVNINFREVFVTSTSKVNMETIIIGW